MHELYCCYLANVVSEPKSRLFCSPYFSRHRKLLTIRFGGDLLVAVFRNYFPFSWSHQTIHNRPCVLSKRIPNWKSIRRMEVELTGRLHCVASRNRECLAFGMEILPPIRISGIAKTRKYFTIYKSLFNLNNPYILRSSTAATATSQFTIFQRLSSWSATTLYSDAKYVCIRLLYENWVRMKNWERKKTFRINAEIMWHYLKLKSIFAIVAFCSQFNLLYPHFA